MAKILVIDDERSVRNTLKNMLEYEGYQVDVAQSVQEGIAKSRDGDFDFVLCDAKYSQGEGADIIDVIHQEKPGVQILVTSHDRDIRQAIDCIKRGAVDFLEKPINLNKLLVAIKEGMDKSLATSELPAGGSAGGTSRPAARRTARRHSVRVEEITGDSPKIRRVKDLIDKVAPSEARVLITGANGTGKELVARWLHEKSPRSTGPFVEVNCAAIPSELIESELFGHEKGAFTSAIRQRKGKFEQADGGTLFLDEIGDMSLSAQAKVLRVLQENRLSRVGSDKDIEVNVRVVAATNKNLCEEIEKRNFREDLYHRLSVIVIRVPALAERPEDIPVLVDTFIGQISEEYRIPRKKIEPDAVAELQKMSWTGNIRQLRNVVERLIILSENSITLDDVKKYASGVE